MSADLIGEGAHAEAQRRGGDLIGEAEKARKAAGLMGCAACWWKHGAEGVDHGAALPLEAVRGLLEKEQARWMEDFRGRVEKEMARLRVLRGLDARLAGGLAGAIYDEAIRGLEGLLGDAGGTPAPQQGEEGL